MMCRDVQAFSSLSPVRVLWTMKERSLPAGMTLADLPLGGNTKVVPWVDYNVRLLSSMQSTLQCVL
jgi:hypothetical protein